MYAFSKLNHMMKDLSLGLKFVPNRKLPKLFNDNFHVLQSFSIIDLFSIVQIKSILALFNALFSYLKKIDNSKYSWAILFFFLEYRSHSLRFSRKIL